MMKPWLIILLLAIALTGCASRKNFLITPTDHPVPIVRKKGKHIWIRPVPKGDGTAQIVIERRSIKSW